MKTKYTVGFVFDFTTQNVLLLEKTKPEWQKGFLNGVGGKIENGETPINAMSREFAEETGVDYFLPWGFKTLLTGKFFDLYVYCAYDSVEDIMSLDQKPNDRGEVFKVIGVDDVFKNRSQMISNIPWLIGICLDDDFVCNYEIKTVEE